jgi:hypothetical protein
LLKIGESEIGHPASLRPSEIVAQAASEEGIVYAFVEPAELRRLFALMAGTELLIEMMRELFGSASEM